MSARITGNSGAVPDWCILADGSLARNGARDQMSQATSNRTIKLPGRGRNLAQNAVVFAAQFAAGELGNVLQTLTRGGIGPAWPAAGIAVGALLLCGYSVWPGVAAGAFLLAFLSPLPHWAALVYAGGTTLAALLATFLVRRIVKFDHSLSRLRDALALILLGAFGSSVLSASVGVTTLYAGHIRGWSGFGSAWLIYWLGDSASVLILTPVVLTFRSLFRLRDRLTELAVLLLLLTTTCLVLFGDLPLIQIRLHVLAFAVLPFVMWAAIGIGVSATAFSILLIATVATVETALGSGPFATSTPFVNAVLLDVFFAIVSVTGLTLAATIADREEVERQREQLIREQASIEARLRLSTIVESSEDAIISTNLDGVIVSWNASAQRIFEYTLAEAVGQPIGILIPPELRDQENKFLQRARTDECIEHLETIRVTKTGKSVDVSMTLSPIKDSAGTVVGTSRIARDITERKRADEALRQREKELLEAQRVSQVGSWQWNPETGEVVWSMELYRIADRDPHLPSPTFEQQTHLYTAESWDRLQRAIAEALHTGAPYTLDLEMLRPDGSTRWITDRGEVLRDGAGRITRLRGTAQDITERKHAEDELRKSEEKFRSVFSNAGVGMVIVSPDGRFLATNEAFCDCLGYTEEELLQKTVQSITLPEDWPSFSQKLKEALEKGLSFQRVEKHCLHKSGRIVTTESSGFLVRGSSGEPQYFVGEVLDITQRKLAEEALSSVNRRLIEAQEQERTRVARELHDDINQRIALLAVKLSSLSEQLHPVARGNMEELNEELSRLGSDIQALSHRLHSSKLDYLGLATAAASFCRELSRQQKLKIDLKVAEDFPKAIPQEISLCLFRVLQEALQNATKHSGAQNFEVSLSYAADLIELTVRDWGIGFDPEEATTRSCGVGLTSMRERLKLVNGHLTVDSQPQVGTTINALVPLNLQIKSTGAGA
jgi:PAS domain S-box-containing protein